jgi:phospholipid/cholesterol/gamma-HCH transport system substrate-binding protein
MNTLIVSLAYVSVILVAKTSGQRTKNGHSARIQSNLLGHELYLKLFKHLNFNMKIPKEVKVGAVAVMAIAMFGFGYNYLKGRDIFTSNNNYYGVYTKIDGLIPSNPVLINGYKVGAVSDISMDDESLELMVQITVPSKIAIPQNTIMKLVNSDMIGSKAIELVMGDTTAIAPHKSVLKTEKDEGIAQAVSAVLSSLTKRVNSVLGEIDTAVSGVDLEGTLNDASLALRSFKETADKFNKLLDGKDEQLDRILGDVESTTSGLRKLTPRIDTASVYLATTAEQLSQVDIKQTVERINTLVEELNKTTLAINSSQGTLGKLVNEDSLYVELDATIRQLNSLLKDIEKYPSRYTGITGGQRRRAERQREEDLKE